MKKKSIFTVLYKYVDDDIYHKDLEHETLQDAFNEVLQELYPECLCETHRSGRTIYVSYQNEQDEDDCSEFELPYTLKAIQEYINDFVENNDCEYSEVVIKKSFEYA